MSTCRAVEALIPIEETMESHVDASLKTLIAFLASDS
jgi:hypothetical protein